MSNELLIGIVMVAIFGILYGIGLFMNAPRAKRWNERLQSTGVVHCGTCKRVGPLAIRSRSSGMASSSNMVLACATCGSSDWKIIP